MRCFLTIEKENDPFVPFKKIIYLCIHQTELLNHKTMKKYALTVFILTASLCIQAQNLFVATYNLRYDNEDDRQEGNGWTKRCQVICDFLNFEQPDIFGTQEGLKHQLEDLKRGLDQYDYIGIGREDGKEQGEHSAIFYKKDKLKCLDKGNFWLNETPEKPVLGWDAACVRICTWGKFHDWKTNLTFYFFNLHMDHVGVIARREAAKLVIKKIKEIAGNNAPVILTGDFNVDQHDEIYKIFSESGILKDSYMAAKHRFAENGTFQDFDSSMKSESRIDHIFVSNKFEVNNYAIHTDAYWTANEKMPKLKSGNAPKELEFQQYTHRLPSDHYPVLAKIRYEKYGTCKF